MISLNEINQIADRLMKRHLDMRGRHKGWRFMIDDSPRADGVCHYNVELITISSNVVARGDRSEIAGVLLHEIAHALTPGASHNEVWRKKLVDIIARETFGR